MFLFSPIKHALRTVPIRYRLAYVSALAIVIALLLTLYAFLTFDGVETRYHKFMEGSNRGYLLTLQIERDLNFISRTTRDIMLSGQKEPDLQKIQKRIDAIASAFKAIESAATDTKERSLVEQAHVQTGRFIESAFAMMRDAKPDEISSGSLYQRYKQDLTPLANASRDTFAKVIALKERDLEGSMQKMDATLDEGKLFVLIVGIFGALFVGFFTLAVSLSINSTLGRFRDILVEVSQGLFDDTRIDLPKSGSLHDMGGALQRLIAQIEHFIREINVSISKASGGDFSHAMDIESMHGAFV
ncbi:MAG: hypothetical protein JXK05_10895 [Campylobacterales bacterium]|nr:hypothetical protein [Campylobacterales bacterium]